MLPLQALEKGIVDCLWNPNDPQCVQESMAAAGKGMAAFKDEAISRRIDCIEQSVLGLGKVIQISVCSTCTRAFTYEICAYIDLHASYSRLPCFIDPGHTSANR